MANWQVVRTVGTEEEAALIAGYLEAAGIESEIESLRFHQEPVNFGGMGEVRVLVDAPDRLAAEAVLSAEEAKNERERLDEVESLDAEAEAGPPAAGSDD